MCCVCISELWDAVVDWIFMRGERTEMTHYFAPGPPCVTKYGVAMVPREPNP